MTLLGDARRLRDAIFKSNHYKRVRPTVDGKGTWSACGDCEQLWPCRGSKILEAAEALPRIVAAMEAAEAYIAEMEGQGEQVDVLRRVRGYQRLVSSMGKVAQETSRK